MLPAAISRPLASSMVSAMGTPYASSPRRITASSTCSSNPPRASPLGIYITILGKCPARQDQLLSAAVSDVFVRPVQDHVGDFEVVRAEHHHVRRAVED